MFPDFIDACGYDDPEDEGKVRAGGGRRGLAGAGGGRRSWSIFRSPTRPHRDYTSGWPRCSLAKSSKVPVSLLLVAFGIL